MGSGMLWAAIGGGAKAGMEVLDSKVKEQADERKRAQSITDHRQALMYEMKLKSDMAQQEEERVAGVMNKIDKRGAEIGNERGARELEAARSTVPGHGEYDDEPVTPEMVAAMPPAARAVYEREMGLTDDSALQAMRDKIAASTEVGAPQTVRKGLLDSYKSEQQAEQKSKSEAAKEQREERRADQRDRDADIRERAAEARNNRVLSSLGGGKDNGNRELLSYLEGARKDFAANRKALSDAQESEMKSVYGKAAKDAVALKYKERFAALDEKGAQLKADYDEARTRLGLGKGEASPSAAPKNAAPQSTVKDNRETKPSIESIKGAPPGADIGAYVAGKGWEVRSSGKLIGYAKD